MPGTSTWKEIRAKVVKPEDEERIAKAREKMEAVLRAEKAKRRRDRPTDRS